MRLQNTLRHFMTVHRKIYIYLPTLITILLIQIVLEGRIFFKPGGLSGMVQGNLC